MGFVGVYKAIYDYAPQAEGELAISDGDLLFILEKGDDGWWKAKKAAQSDGEDEPVGDIPNNYVEEVSRSFMSFASDRLVLAGLQSRLSMSIQNPGNTKLTLMN